jgi:hypothetical protein
MESKLQVQKHIFKGEKTNLHYEIEISISNRPSPSTERATDYYPIKGALKQMSSNPIIICRSN